MPKKSEDNKADMSSSERKQMVKALINKINREAKSVVVRIAEEAPSTYYLRRPCGVMQLDIDTGGGLPAGAFSTIAGPDNCIADTSFIRFETRHKDGKRSNHKGGTIKTLYKRFHEESAIYNFYAPAINDEGHVIQWPIENVVHTGLQQCFEVTTVGGQRIYCTAEHKFFNGNSYKALKLLKVGNTIFVHLNTTKKNLGSKDKIKSIRAAGAMWTYDIKMRYPYHNYIANNIVVHNSGKSMLLYKYFAMHQRLYGRESYVALAASEGQLDYFAARKAGWKLAVPDAVLEAYQEERRLRGVALLTKDEIKELKTEVGTNILVYGETGEEILDRLYDVIKSNLFGIVALDSLEGILPGAEAGLDTLEDNPQQAAHASIITRFLKRYGPTTTGISGTNWTTFIATCQVRSNRKKSEVQSYLAKYMKDWTETAPRAARHWRHINITVQNGEKLWEGSKENRKLLGKVLKWEISKGKTGTHDGLTGEVNFYYNTLGLTNDIHDLILCALKYGVLIEQGGFITLLHDGAPDKHLAEVPGVDALADALSNDFELELAVRREVLAAAGKTCLYR